jgi:hypothetical protein
VGGGGGRPVAFLYLRGPGNINFSLNPKTGGRVRIKLDKTYNSSKSVNSKLPDVQIFFLLALPWNYMLLKVNK